MEQETFPVLYILMRTDLPSMNSGKAIAQGSHASNCAVNDFMGDLTDNSDKKFSDDYHQMMFRWRAETAQGFGTVLVLGVTERQMRSAVQVASALAIPANIIEDPTYPYIMDAEQAALVPNHVDTHQRINIADNKVVMHRSEDTCAYIFGDKNSLELQAVVGKFKLHP